MSFNIKAKKHEYEFILHEFLSKDGKGVHVDSLCPAGSVLALTLRSLVVEEEEGGAGVVKLSL